jgi:hypothetical protein
VQLVSLSRFVKIWHNLHESTQQFMKLSILDTLYDHISKRFTTTGLPFPQDEVQAVIRGILSALGILHGMVLT